MGTLLHSESRRLYSWWWDSHISPKNSKWLQENLTEIDAKVKAMIKIINEDADSFARRAEMYYKKRPELMKLVEDFYRAYRALAERYDHATGELRIAHKSMPEAFPNQLSSMLNDDIPSHSEQPSAPVNPHLVRAFSDPDALCNESDIGVSRKGLKQLNEMFQTGEAMLRDLKSEEEKLMHNVMATLPNSENAEEEMRSLKEALAKLQDERDLILDQYKQSLDKLSDLEKELNSVQKGAKELDQQKLEAENEVTTLKKLLVKLEAESAASLDQYKESSQKLASLEVTITAAQEEKINLSNLAVKAETICQNLKQEISICETEKQEALECYEESMEKISTLEGRLLLAEENTKRLYEQISLAENEVTTLQKKLSALNEEKEASHILYQQCLETVQKLQNELVAAKEDIRRLNGELELGSAKLRGAEEQCSLFDKMNELLKLQAGDLVQSIAEKDQELYQKHVDLEKLMRCLQDEETRFLQVEATLNSLQDLHSRSQEEQRDMALEFRNVLQLLKDLELCKQDLEVEVQHLREENQGLKEMNVASCIAEREMEQEVVSLKEIKEKLEVEVWNHEEQNVALQHQLHQLKEEIDDLQKKYQDLLQQVESAGVDPKCVGSTIKDLRDESLRLKEIFNEEGEEKEALLKKLEDMEGILEKNTILESFLADVNIELERSKEKTKFLQESGENLGAEKLTLVAEKSDLLSQLQTITGSMQGLLEKNALLENSLQFANVELEGLRVKSKSLEDVCQLLSNEKSDLQSERSMLISQLEFVENKVEKFEMRFANLEDNYVNLEKEKEFTSNQVEELRTSLGAEKLNSEARLSGLEDQINILQDDNKCRMKDFEEQLEKSVNAQVEIFILQKFIQDMEAKNYNLIVECQKHAETEKFSEEVISELVRENMMQHLEIEFLLERVDKLGRGIFQVLKALEIDNVSEFEPEVFITCIPGAIKGIRRDLAEGRDESQRFWIQNSVLSAVIWQLSSDGAELANRSKVIDNEFFLLNQNHVMLEHEKDKLLEKNRHIDTIVAVKERAHEILEAEMQVLSLKNEESLKECAVLQEKHSAFLEVNDCLKEKLSEFEEENNVLVEENSAVIMEALSFSNQCVVYKSMWVQKAVELEKISEEINHLGEAYIDSENEARALKEKLAVKENENVQLEKLIQNLEEKNHELTISNDELNHQFLVGSDELNQKEMEHYRAEQRIKALEDAHTDLHMHCQGLDVVHGSLKKRISELTQYKDHQEMEIVSLREANENLERDLYLLNEEIEACKIREVILSSELHERTCEFELWETEASSFYFDLQTSGVREALYENKVHELSGFCEEIEDVSVRRRVEIETMKDRLCFLESESSELKSELASYIPAIASLKNNIVLLEENPALKNKLSLTHNSRQQVVQEFTVRDISERPLVNADEKSSSVLDGLSDLHDLQSRVEAISSAMKEIEVLKSHKPTGSRSPERGNSAHMKDIPLDYISDTASCSNRRKGSDKLDKMLALWETSEQDADTGPTEMEKQLGVDKPEVSQNVGNKKNVLEGHASDAQKLERLHNSVQELKRKIGSYNNNKKRKGELSGQLQAIEAFVVQLTGLNTELTNSVDSMDELVELERARKEAERIEKLELDVQKMEDMLLELEDEKNKNKKGKNGFLRNRLTIVFKDFFIHGRGKKKRTRFCGCFRPSFQKQV